MYVIGERYLGLLLPVSKCISIFSDKREMNVIGER